MTRPHSVPKLTLATVLGTCPGCAAEIAPRVQLALESIRAAAKWAAMSELLILCPQCRGTFVVSQHPAPERTA